MSDFAKEVLRSLRAQEQVLERLLGIAYKVTRKERGVRDATPPPEEDRNGVYALAVLGHLQNLVEAVRALKPAPFQAPTEKLYAAALEEIDRMNKVIADQALTIGTLKDENGRLADTSAAQQAALKMRAELKRFREREAHLEVLYDDLAGYQCMLRQFGEPVTAECVEEHVAAVRDFKVTPCEADYQCGPNRTCRIHESKPGEPT